MNIIREVPESFLNGFYLMPTDRENIKEGGEFYFINKIPILRVHFTPNLKKNIKKIVYLIRDKYSFSKPISGWLSNLFNYIKEKKSLRRHYRAKKAWFRAIGDLFKDIENWEFRKVINKVMSLLRSINPILVIELHDISKWHHGASTIKFIKELYKRGISIVLRYPQECHNHIKKIFREGRLNIKGAIKYFARKLNYYISDSVAEYLSKISQGNLEVVYLILKCCKRTLRSAREIKIPWLKILPYIVDSKYRKFVELAIELRSFTIEDIYLRLNYKLPTVYRYLDDLAKMGILKKIKARKKIRFKLKLKKEKLISLLENYRFKKPWLSIYLLDSIPVLKSFEFSSCI
ncbi:transcriptional regulator [Methanocaldococcus infernus]